MINEINIINFFFGNCINVYLLFIFHRSDESIKICGQLVFFSSIASTLVDLSYMSLGMVLLHII